MSFYTVSGHIDQLDPFLSPHASLQAGAPHPGSEGV